jgi:hypothetical protein
VRIDGAELVAVSATVKSGGVASIPSNRGDFGCSDVGRVADLVVPALGRAGWSCPRFLPEGSQRLGGPGRAEGASRAARCEAPWRPEGRPRILRGLTRAAAAQPPPLFRLAPAGWLVGHATCGAWASS